MRWRPVTPTRHFWFSVEHVDCAKVATGALSTAGSGLFGALSDFRLPITVTDRSPGPWDVLESAGSLRASPTQRVLETGDAPSPSSLSPVLRSYSRPVLLPPRRRSPACLERDDRPPSSIARSRDGQASHVALPVMASLPEPAVPGSHPDSREEKAPASLAGLRGRRRALRGPEQSPPVAIAGAAFANSQPSRRGSDSSPTRRPSRSPSTSTTQKRGRPSRISSTSREDLAQVAAGRYRA